MMRAISLLCFCLLFSLYSSANTTNTWLDTFFVERAFKQVVFNDEFRRGTYPLSKWEKPIHYWVHHDTNDKVFHQELVELHFEQLRELTDLSISKASSEQRANFVIYFTTQSRWKALVNKTMGKESGKHTDNALCLFGSAISQQDYSIARSIVVIPVDRARQHGKLVSCVIEETTQALGLRNDTEQAYPSVFNDASPENYLSPLDVVLIQLMYEPIVESGITETEITPLLREMIDEYRRFGVLSDAVNQANSAPLVKQYK
ncbi:DUF2927 domain-containing protein [Vibrio sp. RC27]